MGRSPDEEEGAAPMRPVAGAGWHPERRQGAGRGVGARWPAGEDELVPAEQALAARAEGALTGPPRGLGWPLVSGFRAHSSASE